MSHLSNRLIHKAVYWEPTGKDKYGNATYAAARQIDCRWVVIQQQFNDPAGNTVVSNAVVYVGEELKFQGVLWQGLLADVASATEPLRNDGAWQIRGKRSVAFNRKPNKVARKVYL